MKKLISIISLLVVFVSYADNPLSINLYFDENSSELSKKETKRFDELIDQIAISQITKVQVLGYTANEGDELNEYLLSKKRAVSVKEYLTLRKVNPSLIDTYFFSNKTKSEAEESEHRNVRIFIYYKEANKKPVDIIETFFDRIPFDLNGDGSADFEATYVKIGGEEFFKWKGQIKEIRKENRTLVFHFHRTEQSYLMPGDTLADVPKKRWGRNTDVLVRYGDYNWGPYREDLHGQTEFYCGFKLIEGEKRSVGWLKFRVIPATGELILADKEIRENEWIVVGKH